MPESGSLFWKATQNNEDVASDLLCALMRDKFSRDVVLRSLGVSSQQASKVAYSNIQTRRAIRETGVPDIVIEGKGYRIFLEVKIETGTPLQESQVTSYPRKL